MENRQMVGFDRGLPGHGLLIWHVGSQFWHKMDSNNANATHPQTFYPVCAASQYIQPNSNPNSYGNIDGAGCPYPGTSQKTEFTDNSIPSAKSWNGANIYRPITNISEVDTFIVFSYTGRPTKVFTIPYYYNFTEASHYVYYKSLTSNKSGISNWQRFQDVTNWTTYLRTYYNYAATPQEYWLFLPAFFLYSNYDYTISFDARVYRSNRPGNLGVYLCEGQSMTGNKLVGEFSEIPSENYEKYTMPFKSNSTGIYYIALAMKNNEDDRQLYIDNISITGVVGIEEEDANRIIIYPNPVTNSVYINNEQDIAIKRVELFDTQGNMIIGLDGAIEQIDVSGYPTGLYFIDIQLENDSHILRNFIINK
jgi:hypothetical protein